MADLTPITITQTEKGQIDELLTQYSEDEILHQYTHGKIPSPLGEHDFVGFSKIVIGLYVVAPSPNEQNANDIQTIKLQLLSSYRPNESLKALVRIDDVMKNAGLL